MDIVNDEILNQILISSAEKIISSVSDKILTQLQDDIKRDIYTHDYFPNKYYVAGSGIPTFDFLRAWKWDVIRTDIMTTTRELYYDYLSMVYDPENFIHGNRTMDKREELADDLNVSGIANNSDFGRKERAPFWSNFLYEMLEEGQLESWFDEEFESMGFIKI